MKYDAKMLSVPPYNGKSVMCIYLWFTDNS